MGFVFPPAGERHGVEFRFGLVELTEAEDQPARMAYKGPGLVGVGLLTLGVCKGPLRASGALGRAELRACVCWE